MNSLIENIDKLHTTKLGEERIKRNLQITTEDVVDWSKTQILLENTLIERMVKIWYATVNNC